MAKRQYSDDELAFDGSSARQRRALTPRERDILCRLIRQAVFNDDRPDSEVRQLTEIAHVIDPRREW